MRDGSNGYEAIAETFVRVRRPSIGPKVLRKWAQRLKPGCSMLDLGCGHGVPISQTLLEEGFAVYGVDASETLVAEFRKRFPGAPVECNSVEDSSFFHCTFDAAVAWGLIFLLGPDSQRGLIGKVARALNKGGQFLFTSPKEICRWEDNLTGRASISLGHDAYAQELATHGLELVGTDEDEGGNYYYFAAKTGKASPGRG